MIAYIRNVLPCDSGHVHRYGWPIYSGLRRWLEVTIGWSDQAGYVLPHAKVVRRELAGVPKVEVVGLSKEKVEELFWETITQVRADLAGLSQK